MARRSNKLVTDQASDKPEIELTDFETAFNSFIRECKLKNLSKHTVKYYRDELLAFRTMLERQGISTKPGDITLKIIKENVIVYMMETLNRKETSINTRLRAIRAFFNFLEKDRQIYENPVRELSLLKQKKEVVETFSRDQLKDLLRQPDLGTFTGFRDYTIMLLLIETGVRVRELTDICVKDIRWEDSQIRIDGKGYKERLVPIQATMKRQLRKYVQVRGDVPNEALFVTIDNTPLTIRQVQNRLRQYGRKANIKNVRCSPHTFRTPLRKCPYKMEPTSLRFRPF